jgi:hypothetical protein
VEWVVASTAIGWLLSLALNRVSGGLMGMLGPGSMLLRPVANPAFPVRYLMVWPLELLRAWLHAFFFVFTVALWTSAYQQFARPQTGPVSEMQPAGA